MILSSKKVSYTIEITEEEKDEILRLLVEKSSTPNTIATPIQADLQLAFASL